MRRDDQPDHLEIEREWRDKLIETVAEHDDEMMELFLEGEEPTEEQLRAAIRRATIKGAVTPVLCGSAFKNKGIQPLLDAIVYYLPAPTDIPAFKGHAVGNEDEVVERHAGGTVVVACHGGVIVQAMIRWLGLDPFGSPEAGERAWFSPANASITEWRHGRNPYGAGNETWELVRFNDHAHLVGTPLSL